MSNTVYIAAAGSGKTTMLVNKACEIKSPENVLILTYTDSNEDEIGELSKSIEEMRIEIGTIEKTKQEMLQNIYFLVN